jgi:hypothetical protein
MTSLNSPPSSIASAAIITTCILALHLAISEVIFCGNWCQRGRDVKGSNGDKARTSVDGGAHMRHLLACGMFMFMFYVVLNYVVTFASYGIIMW